LDIPLNNLIVVYETSTGSPPNSQIVLSSLNVSTENILKKDENNFIEEPGQNPDDLLSGFVTDNSGTIFQEGVNEDLSVVIDENGFSYIEDVSSQISVNDNTTVVRPPSKKPNLGDFFVKNAYGTFIVNPLYGLAGTYLLQFMKELETYLKGKGLILGLASNGITRSIESTLSGGKYRSTTSKHASGLAIDMLIDTVEVNTVSKVSLTSRGYPNGGYNKIGYLEANKILDKIPNLRTYISAFTQSYPGNGGKRFNMIWGGNFGGYNVSEFHHFEISDDSMGQFFEPYKSKLQIANINIPKKQKDLGDVYNLGIV